MKVENAVEVAMDWLAQLREEGHDEASWDAEDQPPAAVTRPDAALPPPVAAPPPPVAIPRPAAAPWPAAPPPAVVPPPAVAMPRPAAVPPPPVAIPQPAAAPPGAALPRRTAMPRHTAVPPSTALPRRQAAPPPAAVPPPRSRAVPPASESARRTGIRAPVEITERAAIGDELRIPIAWCEMGSCISHYTDPEALGEADIRARAIDAGWRVDALRRLACPKCQQSDSWFWTAHPVALWDRDTAVAMTTLMAEAARMATTGVYAASAETPAVARGGPAAPPSSIRVWHPDHTDGVTWEGSRGNDQSG